MYYQKFVKESKKANPNRDVISNYLNMESPARRNWIEIVTLGHRSEESFQTYPCFTDPRFSDPIEVQFSWF